MRDLRSRNRYGGGTVAARRGGGAPLPYANGVPLTGSAGSYIRTPDRAELDFSTDIEVVMRVKVTDWTAAANQTLAGKYISTGNQRSWRFYVNTSGAIGLTASADGTAVTSIIVTPTNALPDATWIWLRMRLDLTNGSNSVGTLETATDAGTNTEPSSWTANGTNTGTTISGIFDSTAPTEIGTFGSGTLERMTGQVGRCIVRSGFAGTVVADFDSSLSGPTGYTDAYGNAWAIN